MLTRACRNSKKRKTQHIHCTKFNSLFSPWSEKHFQTVFLAFLSMGPYVEFAPCFVTDSTQIQRKDVVFSSLNGEDLNEDSPLNGKQESLRTMNSDSPGSMSSGS